MKTLFDVVVKIPVFLPLSFACTLWYNARYGFKIQLGKN